jgi:hypothetical protein
VTEPVGWEPEQSWVDAADYPHVRPRTMTSERGKIEWLEYVADMNRKGFDVARSGRRRRKETAEALVAEGLLKHAWAVVCDGDGWPVQPERERLGYELTDAGRDRLRAALERSNGV